MTLNYDIEADVLFKKGLEKNRLELEKSRAEAERNRLKAETSILEANEKIESIKEASVLALLKTENLSTSEIVSSLQVSEEWVLQIKSKM